MGPQAQCPYCGASISQRISLRVLRYGAWLTALIGLGLLWVAARGADPPTVSVGEVSSSMNWAYVRIHGTVTQSASYDDQTGYLRFWIGDGTGEMPVVLYRNESDVLIARGDIPSVGDSVTAAGTLRIQGDSHWLVVSIPERVEVERSLPSDRVVADITADELYTKVRIRGQVREEREPYSGFHVLAVRDATGQIDVVYGSDLVRLSGEPAAVRVGDSVEVEGAVTQYRGEPQVSLCDAHALRRLSEQVVVGRPSRVAQITPSDVGSLVATSGVLVSREQIGSGIKLFVKDETGGIHVVLWDDLLTESPELRTLPEGSVVEVQGLATEYRGSIELVPELALDVRVVQRAPQLAQRPSATTALTVAPSPTHTPTLEPTPTVARRPTTAPTATPRLAATATRESTPTPTPAAATATPTSSPTWTATPESALPRVSTGSVGPSLLGQTVAVQGKMVSLIAFTSGCKCYLDDGTGNVAVWFPQHLFAQLYSADSWLVGGTLAVAGIVEEYEQEIEIVPRGADQVALLATAIPDQDVPVPIGELKEADLGERVTVEGSVVETETIPQGVKHLLDDGTGHVTLLVWQGVLDTVPCSDRLGVGAVVRATGILQEYRGELEVVPGIGGEIVVQCD